MKKIKKVLMCFLALSMVFSFYIMNTNAVEENVISFPVEFFDIDADGLFFEYFLGDGMDTFGFKNSDNVGPTLGLVSPQLGDDGNPVYTRKTIEGAAQTIQKNLKNHKGNKGLLEYTIFKQLIDKTAATGSVYEGCLKAEDGYFYDRGWTLDSTVDADKTEGQIHTGSGKVIWKHEGDGVVNMGYKDHLTKTVRVTPNTEYTMSCWRGSSDIKYQIRTLDGEVILKDGETKFETGNNSEVIFDIYREDNGTGTIKFSIPKLTPVNGETGENLLGQDGKTFVTEGWESTNYAEGTKANGKLIDGTVYWEQSGDGVVCSEKSGLILKTDITPNQDMKLRYYLGGNGCQADGMKITLLDGNKKVLKTVELEETDGFHEQTIEIPEGEGKVQVRIEGKEGTRIAAMTITPLGSELALGDYEKTEEKYEAGKLTTVEECETCMDYAYLRLKNFFNTDFYLNKKTDLYNKMILTSGKIDIDGEEQESYEFNGGSKIEYDVEKKQFYNSDSGQNDGGFFPLDRLDSEKHTNNHNYHFGMKVSGSFVYKKGSKQFFNFNGDDDVYIFINGKLVVDLGGAHYATDGNIDIEKFAQENGIKNGEICELNMFYLERHTQASNCRIQTNLRLGYLTGYEFESTDPEKTLPEEIIKQTPIDETEYYIGDKVTVDKNYEGFERIKDPREEYDGYWEFRGWKNPEVTIEKEGNIFVGEWEFIENKYKATYQFISGTEGKELPQDIERYLPRDEKSYIKGDIVKVQDPAETTYKDSMNDGEWTFKRWEREENEIVDRDVEFIGVWEFKGNEYKTTHKFVSGTEGKELPEEVKELLPEDREGMVNGEEASVSLEAGKVIEVEGGRWIFKGWDKTHVIINGRDEEFRGTWEYEAEKEEPTEGATLIINKADQDNKALMGAAFKVVKEESGKEIFIEEQEEGPRFEFKGLEDGVYRIYETVAPEGYEGLETYFEIEIREGKIYYEGGEETSFTIYNTNDGTTPYVLGAEYENIEEELEFEDNVLGDEIDTTIKKTKAINKRVKTSDEAIIAPYIILALCSVGLYAYVSRKKRI